MGIYNSTMSAESAQTERAFQKQPTVFLNKKRVLTGSKKKLRHVKSVGLGFKTPREAIDGNYIVKKYNRYEKRHRNMSVHCSPAFRDVNVGDIATVGECRPLSKTVRFNVLKLTKGKGSKKQFNKF